MSVTAAVPRRQPTLPLESTTLIWARSAAFPSPQPPTSSAASSPQTCPAPAAPSPVTLPRPPLLTAHLPAPNSHHDEDALCDSALHGCGLDSEPDGPQQPQPGFCSLLQRQQALRGHADDPAASTSGPLDPARGACGCGECARAPPAPADGAERCGGGGVGRGREDGSAEGDNNEDGRLSGDGLTARRQAHLHASPSKAAAATATAAVSAVHCNGRRQSGSTGAANGAAAADSLAAATMTTTAATLLGKASQTASGGGAAAAAAVNLGSVLGTALQRPSSPQPPIPLPGARSSGSGRAASSSGGGAGAGAAAAAGPRRTAYGVKASAMTSQISAAQRSRAATLIQAAWRGFRIRRLYVRLIVWRLRPPARPHDAPYCGIRELPPVPDLPLISLFTQYGRPGRFRSAKRRMWFGMEGPFFRQPPQPHAAATTTVTSTAPATTTTAPVAATPPPPPPPPAAASAAAPEPSLQPPTTALASSGHPLQQLPPPPPQQQQQQAVARPRPGAARVPLRLVVPPRAEADVPMSEVERILAGGFWRVEERGAGAGLGGGRSGGGGEGEEGLSMYMRAKMRQEEREAEEALQMLSYEPHDLKHLLGSLKERTLERLGSLGRTIGETLSSGLHLNLHLSRSLGGSRAVQHEHGHGQNGHGQHGQWQGHGGFGNWHWPGTGAGAGAAQQAQGQARSLPRMGLWGASAGGGRPRRLHCATLAPSVASGSIGCTGDVVLDVLDGLGLGSLDGGVDGDGEWSLRAPLLPVLDSEAPPHTAEPDPNADGVASLITVNWQRYRNRSHLSRMGSF